MVGGCRNLSKRGQEGTEQKRPGLKGMGVGLKEQKKHVPSISEMNCWARKKHTHRHVHT